MSFKLRVVSLYYPETGFPWAAPNNFVYATREPDFLYIEQEGFRLQDRSTTNYIASIPITIARNYGKVFDNFHAPDGYRTAYVRLRAISLGLPVWSEYSFAVVYRADKNFNVEPPPKQSILPQIGPYLTAEPSGDCVAPEYDPSAPVSRDRLNHWQYRLRPDEALVGPGPSKIVDVHPVFDRSLLVKECARIFGFNGVYPRHNFNPKMFSDWSLPTPPRVISWLCRQVELYLSGAWGAKDWESEYVRKTGQWVGTPSDGKSGKNFNLTEWY